MEQHGQQGLALLSLINQALFDPSPSGEAAGGHVYWGICVVLSELFNIARLGGRRQSPETWTKVACGHCDDQLPHCVVAVLRLGGSLGSGEMWGAQQPWRCSLILVLSCTTYWKLSEHLPKPGSPGGPVSPPLARALQGGNRAFLLQDRVH